MASLAEIRARLQAAESKQGGQSTGGDNSIFPHWNIPENSTTRVRFLPDGDDKNMFFWGRAGRLDCAVRLAAKPSSPILLVAAADYERMRDTRVTL